jgi:cytochrome c oxidase subunit 3
MTAPVTLRPPFTDKAQQHAADMMGMYVFIGSEVMLFGGLFAAMSLVRLDHPAAWIAASRELHLWIGTANTAILLTSSLTMALAVATARAGRRTAALRLLLATTALGVVFLALKAVEYAAEYHEGLLPVPGGGEALTDPAHRLFMHLYLIATSLHAVHLTIGIALVLAVALRLRRGLPLPGRGVVVEATGLYWHLVDLVWVFLYPVLYLAR